MSNCFHIIPNYSLPLKIKLFHSWFCEISNCSIALIIKLFHSPYDQAVSFCLSSSLFYSAYHQVCSILLISNLFLCTTVSSCLLSNCSILLMTKLFHSWFKLFHSPYDPAVPLIIQTVSLKLLFIPLCLFSHSNIPLIRSHQSSLSLRVRTPAFLQAELDCLSETVPQVIFLVQTHFCSVTEWQ